MRSEFIILLGSFSLRMLILSGFSAPQLECAKVLRVYWYAKPEDFVVDFNNIFIIYFTS